MSDPICSFCDHPLSQHCKGGKQHTSYKEDARMVDPKWRRATVVCSARHCDNPLCCCPNFKEKD